MLDHNSRMQRKILPETLWAVSPYLFLWQQTANFEDRVLEGGKLILDLMEVFISIMRKSFPSNYGYRIWMWTLIVRIHKYLASQKPLHL